MPHSFTDLTGLDVRAEDFLAAVLGAAGQPIWVVDQDDVIRFANPAALAALGYEDVVELAGHRSRETIHCETVARDVDWFLRRDGSMFPVSYVSVPLEMSEGRGAVVAFTDIEKHLRAERELREQDAVLAARDGSLRRIATLVAGGATSAEVFAAIAREVAQVLGSALVVIWRTAPDRPARVVGAWSDRPHPFQAGTAWTVEERTAGALLPEIGQATRIEDFGAIGGVIPTAIRETGIRSGCGAGIVVDGEQWGVMGTGVAEGEPLPDRIEDRLVELTELIATTIANSASREELTRLAAEQAALRRVATLVARESSPAEVFSAVARELGRLLDATATRLVRYEPDETATIVSGWGRLADAVPVGTRMPLGGLNVISLVARTARPARIDDYDEATGAIAEYGRRLDARGAVGAPIVVAGKLWGAMIVSSRQTEPLPAGTEAGVQEFAELVATAIANVQARSDLAASRARIVAAADDERRRVVRDLHDGAQQRLVHTVVTLKLARQALEKGEGSGTALVAEALDQAQVAIAELRELAHGILPAVLIRGGLRAGVDALASRAPLPVEIRVPAARLPADIEATAYFVVAEALTNVAKHAHAERAVVSAHVEDRTLRLEVRDDGIGGARPDGSGLVGLADRVAVVDGRLRVESGAGGGTLVSADIPLPD